MVKLMICLIAGMAMAVCLLQFRQQRLELNHQTNHLHNQIEAMQSRLWNQQLQIAVYTAPNAIEKTVGDHDLKLAPQAPVGVGPSGWVDEQVVTTSR